MHILLATIPVFIVLVANELWWRKRKAHGEFSRKFVHVTVGSYVAFWPFFLSWRQIEWLSVAFVIVVLVSKALNIFAAIHSVQRLTWGELCFALSVGIVALATHDKWVYMAALLQMSLADGLAAVVGVRFGKSSTYTIMKRTKSIVGTVAFFVTSVIILLFYAHYGDHHITIQSVMGLALIASLLENISISGLDNLTVPLVVALFLSN